MERERHGQFLLTVNERLEALCLLRSFYPFPIIGRKLLHDKENFHPLKIPTIVKLRVKGHNSNNIKEKSEIKNYFKFEEKNYFKFEE